MSPRRITFVVHKDGDAESRSVGVPVWLVRWSLFGTTAFGVLAAVAGVLYAPVARSAAQVPGLQREIGVLRDENARVLDWFLGGASQPD